MKKEILVVLNNFENILISSYEICPDYISFKKAIVNEHVDNIITPCLEALSFAYTENLFVLYNKVKYEITLGECLGTKRKIRKQHNLQKLLLAGEFDWFKG